MCFGAFQGLFHWGPLTALAIIKIVSFCTIFCNSQWWPPQSSLSALINSTLFLFLSGLTIFHFLSALSIGPGVLPLKWHPVMEKNEQFLQFCTVCEGFKAPRSHHCKKCGRCIMKMDHHCPWINNCVGHKNHYNFTLFLFFAVCGCSQATIILSCSLFRAVYKNWYLYHGDGTEPIVSLDIGMCFLTVFALGLSIGVVIAVGMLLYFQLRTILRNRTAIEDWIVLKAEVRRSIAKNEGIDMEPFVFPYNLGYWKNFTQVFNLSFTMGNGIEWNVILGCDQYTLTREQLAQKIEKKQRSRPFSVVKNFSGYRFPLTHGFKVLFSHPCNDEPRIKLIIGETVMVTRYARHWLFGEKANSTGKVPIRGWFPRMCVVPIEDTDQDNDEPSQKKVI